MYSGSTQVPRHSLTSFLRAAKELGVVGLTEKDIDIFSVEAEKDIDGLSVVKEMEQQPEQMDKSSQSEVVREQEAVKEKLPVMSKYPKNYSCSSFKFTCVGHDTLKDHIRSTKVAQADAQTGAKN